MMRKWEDKKKHDEMVTGFAHPRTILSSLRDLMWRVWPTHN
jgi:hypothetical protein